MRSEANRTCFKIHLSRPIIIMFCNIPFFLIGNVLWYFTIRKYCCIHSSPDVKAEKLEDFSLISARYCKHKIFPSQGNLALRTDDQRTNQADPQYLAKSRNFSELLIIDKLLLHVSFLFFPREDNGAQMLKRWKMDLSTAFTLMAFRLPFFFHLNKISLCYSYIYIYI